MVYRPGEISPVPSSAFYDALHRQHPAFPTPEGSSRLVFRFFAASLANPAIRVREWYKFIAIQWLEAQFRHLGEIHLIVYGTKIGFGHQLLIVSLAYRKRAIPIAWTWVKHVKGHSSAIKQLAYVRKLIPFGATVFLVGDCEFGAVEVLRQLDKWHWFYVMRQKTDTCIWFNGRSDWQTFGSYIQKPGQSIWLGNGYQTIKEIYKVNLMVYWKIGEKEPWCLTTNLPDMTMSLKFYKRRMWVEGNVWRFQKAWL